MTDLEKMKDMFTRANISFHVEDKGLKNPKHKIRRERQKDMSHVSPGRVEVEVYYETVPGEPEFLPGSIITLNTNGGNNAGYSGFYTEFVFDGDGNLLSTGVWE
jgi:hypothetical protein